MESWVAVEPAGDCRRFVGGVVVTDQVHVQVGGDVVVQLGEELFELGGSVAAVDGAGDLAGGHVQRGEQGGDAVAQVVVGAPLGHPGHHRQHRSRAVQRLNLGLLVHAEHQRLFRGVQVEADHVAHLVDELRITADLEGVDLMRLEPERFPDPAHRRLGQSGFGGHRCPRPVRGVVGLTLQRRHDHLLDLGVGDHARRTRTWLISQPVEARLHEPPPPHPYRLRPHTDLSSHLLVGFTCRATQHDPTPLCQRLRRLRSPRPPLQRFPLLVGQHQLSYRPAPTRHAPSLQLVIEFMAQGTRHCLLCPPLSDNIAGN